MQNKSSKVKVFKSVPKNLDKDGLYAYSKALKIRVKAIDSLIKKNQGQDNYSKHLRSVSNKNRLNYLEQIEEVERQISNLSLC